MRKKSEKKKNEGSATKYLLLLKTQGLQKQSLRNYHNPKEPKKILKVNERWYLGWNPESDSEHWVKNK